MSVSDIAQGLSIMMEISIDSIRTMVVPRDTEFPLYELNQKSPPTNFGRSWFDPTQEKRLLRVVSHDMKVRDGDLLLIQDEREALRELTKADLKSIEIGKAMTQYSDFWGGDNGNDYSNIGSLYNTNNDSSLYSGYTDDATTKDSAKTHVPSFNAVKPTTIRSFNNTTIRSTGIHIKTQRERQEEEDARLKEGVNDVLQITSNYNNNNNINSINNNNNYNNNSNSNRDGHNSDQSSSSDVINDMIPEEYSRDGSYNLFGDIY